MIPLVRVQPGRRLWFGKHHGTLIEQVMLKAPDYIHWCLRELPRERFRAELGHIEACMELFDAKPLTALCSERIGNRATGERCTRTGGILAISLGVQGVVRPAGVVCDECVRARGRKAIADGLIESYEGALSAAGGYSGRRECFRRVVKAMAEAKGLTRPWTEEKVLAFFHD